MNYVCVKLKQRESNKYRKMLAVGDNIFPEFEPENNSVLPYTAGAFLQDGELFFVDNVKNQNYRIDLLTDSYSTVDFEELSREDFGKIDFLFVINDRFISFQNISKAKLIRQKRIVCFGERFAYQSDCEELAIRDFPDAIYDKATDVLYFHKLESVTSIFKGIDQLYREATQEEVETFLANDFISLKDGYASSNVKKANRKRIALAAKTLAELNETGRKNIFQYIGDYCPKLKASENAFEIGSESELKLLLYGIEQRFYTTPVGGEKRIANSVVSFE